MPTISLKYVELDPANPAVKLTLGTESYDEIEESLLPKNPLPNKPVFITKKFVGHAEYRWQVKAISVVQPNPAIFEVTLGRSAQLSKSYYLPEILRGKTIMSVLQKYAFVEVEFGHAPSVGKSDGDIKSNKRYVDTVQDGNMPKRRLAIVLRATSKRPSGAIVQVVPISSVAPHPGDRTAIEVTSSLTTMANYNKQSWAICGMVESIAAGRIIAPMVNWGRMETRDTGFSTKLDSALRPGFEAALLHGLDRANVNAQLTNAVTASTQLTAQNAILANQNLQLNAQLATLTALQQHAAVHEEMAKELAVLYEVSLEELRDIFVK